MGTFGSRTGEQAQLGAPVDRPLEELGRRRPHLTVVVPTRNEAGNVEELVIRLDAALGTVPAEILFVDDSDDGTPDVVRAAARRSPRDVRLLHREPGRREGGLGGAVIAGFQVARAPLAVVIDGDLQHPPELLPRLIEAVDRDGVDLAYGTRYADAGSAAGRSGGVRHAVARMSTLLAKGLFPRRLRGVSDPMSGFFAVRLDALDLPNLRPDGYKVLLPILVGSRPGGIAGVPFTFRSRNSGESKSSPAEGLRFGRQLLALRLGVTGARLAQFAAFAAVGASGVAVNTIVLWALLLTGRLSYLAASVIATNVAILWNFALLQGLVFRGSGKDSPISRLGRFWLLNVALLPVQLGLLALSVEGAGLGVLTANAIVLVLVLVLRYALSATLVFHDGARWFARTGRSRRPRVDPAASTFYLARVVPVVALALLAFPSVAVRAWGLVAGGGWADVGFVVAAGCAATIVALRAAPGANEPDVHDRQLDIILAIPLLGTGIWLAVGWPTPFVPDTPWTARDVLGFEAFLIGVALLLLGTRLAIRLRWALLLPLLALPWLVERPAVLVTAIVLLACGTGVALVRHRRAGGLSAGPAPVRAHRQRLPAQRFAAAVVTAVSAALALLAIAADGRGTDNPGAGDSVAVRDVTPGG